MTKSVVQKYASKNEQGRIKKQYFKYPVEQEAKDDHRTKETRDGVDSGLP